MEDRERRKVIDQTLVQLEKQFGKGSIVRLGSSNVVPVSVIPTGSISIDAALGVGGKPRGRAVLADQARFGNRWPVINLGHSLSRSRTAAAISTERGNKKERAPGGTHSQKLTGSHPIVMRVHDRAQHDAHHRRQVI